MIEQLPELFGKMIKAFLAIEECEGNGRENEDDAPRLRGED